MRRYLAVKLCEWVLWFFGQPVTRLVLTAWNDAGILWGIHAPVWEPDPLPTATRVRGQLSDGLLVELPPGWRLEQLDRSRDQ